MNFRNLIYIMLAAFGLCSCRSEDLSSGGTENQTGTTPYYVKLQLKTSDDSFLSEDPTSGDTTFDKNTSDGGYSNGKHSEHAIATGGNFAIFFDAQDRYISWADLYSVNEVENTPGTPETEATFTTRFYGYADRVPAKVLVVVNASDEVKEQITDFPGWTLKDALSQIWTAKNLDAADVGRRTENGVTYLTMSNSTFIETVDGEKSVHCAEPINPILNIATSEEDLSSLEPVTVYVERMVSKFSFNLTNSSEGNIYRPHNQVQLNFCSFADDRSYVIEPANWQVEVTGWGINGLENKSHVFKNISTTNPYVNSYSDWNSTVDRRCFWSEDPHYGEDFMDYPWQYRMAFDVARPANGNDTEFFRYYSDPHRKTDLPLTNYNYIKLNGDLTKDLYAPENTYDPLINPKVDMRADVLAGSHVVVCGKITLDTDLDGVYELDDFFCDRVGVCYKDSIDMFEAFINAVNFKLKSQTQIDYIYYNWNNIEDPQNGKKRSIRTSGPCKLYFNGRVLDYALLRELAIDDKRPLTIPARVLNSDGKVYPWITEENDEIRIQILDDEGNALDIYDEEGNLIERDSSDSNDIKSIFYEISGACDHYRNGLTYYPVAIPALSKGNPTGCNGVVRNNWYKFTLHSITNLGVPVDYKESPIVPNYVLKKDQIKLELVILKWHLSDQNVNIFESH